MSLSPLVVDGGGFRFFGGGIAPLHFVYALVLDPPAMRSNPGVQAPDTAAHMQDARSRQPLFLSRARSISASDGPAVRKPHAQETSQNWWWWWWW